MNSSDFMTGQAFEAIYFEGDEEIAIGTRYADKILCRMECGQMAGVAWFEVWKDGKVASKWNGAKLLGVKPLSQKTGDSK